MAQFYTDFSEYTSAAEPADWTEAESSLGTGGFTVEDVVGAVGGKVLRVTDGARWGGVTWDDIASVADVEVVAKVRATGAPNGFFDGHGPMARYGTDAYAATISQWNTSTQRSNLLETSVGGGSASLVSGSAPTGVNTTDWSWVRLRVSGTTIDGWYWLDGDTEKTNADTPDRTTTDATLTTGLVGLFGDMSSDGSVSFECDVFGVGTAGDDAPIAPLGGGTDLSVSAELESVESTTFDASVVFDKEVSSNLESVETSTFDASVTFSSTVSAALESIEATTFDATVAYDRPVGAALDTVEVTSFTATVSTSTDLIFTTNASNIEVTQPVASVLYDVSVASNLESVEVTTFLADIDFANDLEFTTNPSAIELTDLNATLTKTLTFTTALEEVAVSAHTATVDFLDSFVRIDGQGSATISTNYGSLRLYYQNGSYYSIN